MVKPISLVKYAGDFWITLADFSRTRSTEGYSDEASVKSASRTFVVRTNPNKYIAFRGEKEIKNIIQENRYNPLFHPEDLQGLTRTALIMFDMLEPLNERFKVKEEYKEYFEQFMQEATEYIAQESSAKNNDIDITFDIDSMVESRSLILKQLRQELERLDKEIQIRKNNREKIVSAISAISSLELEEVK